MRVLLLNGNPDGMQNTVDSYMKGLATALEERENEVIQFELRSMTINQCTGCWDCWTKTPGRCRIKDDMELIYQQVPKADQFVIVSPIKAGYLTALTKTMQDRMIPLLHPHITLVENECHHVKRYEHYPRLNAIFEREELTDEEDLKIIFDLMERVSRNMRGGKGLVTTTTHHSPQEAANEISRI